MSDPLRRMGNENREFVKRLISLVCEQKSPHKIALARRDLSPTQVFSYWISFDDKSDPGAPNPLWHTEHLDTSLVASGFAEALPGSQTAFRFTGAAFDWYRELTSPTDAEIQEVIASALVEIALTNPYMYELIDLDVHAVANQLDVDVSRVSRNANALVMRGYAAPAPEGGHPAIGDGGLHVSQSGSQWYYNGFPTSATNVNVQVGVTATIQIEATISYAISLHLPESLEKLLEEHLNDFKEEPRFSKFMAIVGLAADTAALAEHGPRVADAVRNVVTNFVASNASTLIELLKWRDFLWG